MFLKWFRSQNNKLHSISCTNSLSLSIKKQFAHINPHENLFLYISPSIPLLAHSSDNVSRLRVLPLDSPISQPLQPSREYKDQRLLSHAPPLFLIFDVAQMVEFKLKKTFQFKFKRKSFKNKHKPILERAASWKSELYITYVQEHMGSCEPVPTIESCDPISFP